MTKFLRTLVIILVFIIIEFIRGNFIDANSTIKNLPKNIWESISYKYGQFINVKGKDTLYLNDKPIGKVKNVIVDEKENLITFEKISFNDSEIFDLLMSSNKILQFQKYEIRIIQMNTLRYPPTYKNVKSVIIKNKSK